MPKPPTFTDGEMRDKITTFYFDNSRFPTIAEVKAMGCGDSRAQRILSEVKELDPQPEFQPQPQPQSGPAPALDISESMIVVMTNKTQWVDISKLPAWLTKRVLDYLSKGVKT